MTTEQKLNLAIMQEAWKRKGIPEKVVNFGFEITCYPDELSMFNHRGLPACVFIFPSIRAAKHYMDDAHPSVYFYDIEVVYSRPNCPAPYILET